jgi:hypothetical protein
VKLTCTRLRAIIAEVTKLPREYYTEIDRVVQGSQFWKEDNSSDEVIVRRGQPQTDAAATLQEALRALAKELGMDTIFYVESPVDGAFEGLELGPDHPADVSEWLYNANMLISEPSGRKKLTLDMMTLSGDFDFDNFNPSRLVKHITSTIRHELIHRGQIQQQSEDRGDKSMLATFRRMKLDPKQMPDEDDPKYKDPETGEWLTDGRQHYFKDYLRAHIETDAYAHEAAELLVDEFGDAGALEILRRPIDTTDNRLPTALTKYAEIGEPETMKKVKGKIYKYIQSFKESFLRGYVRELLHETS